VSQTRAAPTSTRGGGTGFEICSSVNNGHWMIPPAWNPAASDETLHRRRVRLGLGAGCQSIHLARGASRHCSARRPAGLAPSGRDGAIGSGRGAFGTQSGPSSKRASTAIHRQRVRTVPAEPEGAVSPAPRAVWRQWFGFDHKGPALWPQSVACPGGTLYGLPSLRGGSWYNTNG
jgi:hypothetical protein